jgi:hypothetical protein
MDGSRAAIPRRAGFADVSLSELLYGVAFITYMVGAAWSLRSNGAGAAVAVLGCGAAMDFGLTALVMWGPEVFSFGIEGSNFATQLGAILGVAVWSLVVGALFAWRRRRLRAFHVLVVVGQLVWFVDYLAFLYGIHAYPLT